MDAAPTNDADAERPHDALRTRRYAVLVHWASLVLAAAILLNLGRDQWFHFDEWDFMWPPQAAVRLVEGHNGHWSAVPIAIWIAMGKVLGFGSYLPYLALAVTAHLSLAHLLWRLMLRTGSGPWIATALAAAFALLGTAAENLLWAFQAAYMGAIALAVGALLLALRPRLGPGGIIGIAALLLLAAATAGTSLPFFVATAIVLLRLHGWRTTLWAMIVPILAYAVWFLFIAGPNPTTVYRAEGPADLLAGIPQFVARMFVDGYTDTVGVPGFGIVVVSAIVIWAIVTLGRRPMPAADVVLLSLLASGVVFAVLTAYSRLHAGEGGGTAPRYVYVVIVATLPVIGLLLTRLVAGSIRRLVPVIALILVVLSFNAGSLVVVAERSNKTELATHQVISASLDLADEHPDDVDPDTQAFHLVPRSLAELQVLARQYGLERIPYDTWAELTALATIGLQVAPSAAAATCGDPSAVGDLIVVEPSGTLLRVDAPTELEVTPVDAVGSGDPRTLELDAGTYELRAPERLLLQIEDSTVPVTVCTATDAAR